MPDQDIRLTRAQWEAVRTALPAQFTGGIACSDDGPHQAMYRIFWALSDAPRAHVLTLTFPPAAAEAVRVAVAALGIAPMDPTVWPEPTAAQVAAVAEAERLVRDDNLRRRAERGDWLEPEDFFR